MNKFAGGGPRQPQGTQSPVNGRATAKPRQQSSAIPKHPSVFIREEMDARGYSLNDVVCRMRRFESASDWARERLALELYLEVHDANILLPKEQAEGLANAFDVSPELFTNLHDSWVKWAQAQAKG